MKPSQAIPSQRKARTDPSGCAPSLDRTKRRVPSSATAHECTSSGVPGGTEGGGGIDSGLGVTYAENQPSSSSSAPSTSLTLGSFLISIREIFQARWTTQESERSRRAASSLIS